MRILITSDMDKCETFNPNIFSTDTFDEKSTFLLLIS